MDHSSNLVTPTAPQPSRRTVVRTAAWGAPAVALAAATPAFAASPTAMTVTSPFTGLTASPCSENEMFGFTWTAQASTQSPVMAQYTYTVTGGWQFASGNGRTSTVSGSFPFRRHTSGLQGGHTPPRLVAPATGEGTLTLVVTVTINGAPFRGEASFPLSVDTTVATYTSMDVNGTYFTLSGLPIDAQPLGHHLFLTPAGDLWYRNSRVAQNIRTAFVDRDRVGRSDGAGGVQWTKTTRIISTTTAGVHELRTISGNTVGQAQPLLHEISSGATLLSDRIYLDNGTLCYMNANESRMVVAENVTSAAVRASSATETDAGIITLSFVSAGSAYATTAVPENEATNSVLTFSPPTRYANAGSGADLVALGEYWFWHPQGGLHNRAGSKSFNEVRPLHAVHVGQAGRLSVVGVDPNRTTNLKYASYNRNGEADGSSSYAGQGTRILSRFTYLTPSTSTAGQATLTRASGERDTTEFRPNNRWTTVDATRVAAHELPWPSASEVPAIDAALTVC